MRMRELEGGGVGVEEEGIVAASDELGSDIPFVDDVELRVATLS